MRRRPVTHASPAVEEGHSSEEEDDELIPVYPDVQIPAVPENPDPTIPTLQNTYHTESPGVCPVESTVDAQNVDSTPEFDKPPDMSYSTSDSPLTLLEPNIHQGDTETEYLPTGLVTSLEQVDDTEYPAKENDLPDNKHSADEYLDIQDDQLPLSLDLSENNEDKDSAGSGESEEERKDETAEIETPSKEETDIPVRRSERNHQPPGKLTYPELGNPLVTFVKSFLQNLSSAFIESLKDNDCSYLSGSGITPVLE